MKKNYYISSLNMEGFEKLIYVDVNLRTMELVDKVKSDGDLIVLDSENSIKLNNYLYDLLIRKLLNKELPKIKISSGKGVKNITNIVTLMDCKYHQLLIDTNNFIFYKYR